MSTQVQLRRGTAAQHATFVGAPGEITVDTTNNTLRVHDGITPGGHPLTLQALFDAHLADYEQQIANRVKKDGDTMSGNLIIGYLSNYRYLSIQRNRPNELAELRLEVDGNDGQGVYLSRIIDGVSSGRIEVRGTGASFNGNTIWHSGIAGPFYLGSGSPEGVVTAPVGAIYQRRDGGANTTLYVKESGTGNTGWKAVQTQ